MPSLPVKRFQAGQVQVSVWENESKEGRKFFSFTFQKRYTTEEGKWETTNTLGVNDIPRAVLALQSAFEFAVLKEKGQVDTGTEGKE